MKKKRQKSFLEWAIGKPPALAWIGWMAAAYADECVAFVNRVISGELNSELPRAPDATAMLSVYKEPRKFWEGIIDRGFGGGGAEMLAAGDEWQAFLAQPGAAQQTGLEAMMHDPQFAAAYTKGAAEIGEAMTADGNEVMAELGGAEIPSHLTDAFMESVEGQFLIRVFLPCFLLYGDTPHAIFEQALAGDNEALLKLLRIDKSILADGVVGGRVQEASRNGNDAFVGEFAAAVRAKLKPVKVRQSKIRLAALISLLAKVMQVKVDAPEIQDLFDAVARQKRKSKTIDEDLPDDPATFAREVRLERPKVKVLKEVKGGKKSASEPSG